ncbi:MAG: DNA lyase, partial [Methanothrix sp.]|nr:DNA lyase [Methanothrix sp.]
MDHPTENYPLTVVHLMQQYNPVKPQIEARLTDFRHIWETATDEELFLELIFCLLTPQSKAKTCWKAVERLNQKCMITKAEPAQISRELGGVRFHQRKGEYICLARNMFRSRSLRATLAEFADAAAAREWLVENVKGLGYKE